jgi:hypothetical protein
MRVPFGIGLHPPAERIWRYRAKASFIERQARGRGQAIQAFQGAPFGQGRLQQVFQVQINPSRRKIPGRIHLGWVHAAGRKTSGQSEETVREQDIEVGIVAFRRPCGGRYGRHHFPEGGQVIGGRSEAVRLGRLDGRHHVPDQARLFPGWLEETALVKACQRGQGPDGFLIDTVIVRVLP